MGSSSRPTFPNEHTEQRGAALRRRPPHAQVVEGTARAPTTRGTPASTSCSSAGTAARPRRPPWNSRAAAPPTPSSTRADHRWAPLRGAGIGPDVLAGICVAPSLGCSSACSVILRSAAPGVPLDPAYPSDRLKLRWTTRRCRSSSRSGACSPRCPRALRALLPRRGAACGRRADPGPSAASPDHLPHHLHLRLHRPPQGAMITHRGLVNYLTWASRRLPRGQPGAGAPVHSSLLDPRSRGSSRCSGRCVFIVGGARARGAQPCALRARKNFSLVKITPAHLKLPEPAAAAGGGGGLHSRSSSAARRSARAYVSGGKLARHRDRERIRPHRDGRRLLRLLHERGERFSGAIPIGRPIANTQLYVLDDAMRPAPIGEKGRVLTSAATASRVYPNRPDLNARRRQPVRRG